MVKIRIKSVKLTPFGGIFSIMEQFDSTLSSVIDSTLGLRCRSFGYRYSEILTRHFYDMSNMMSRNEGVWLSNGWVKVFLWIFIYTIASVVYLICHL